MMKSTSYDNDDGDNDDNDDDYEDPTIEIGEDINSMEDLVRFPPPVVFCLKWIIYM